MNLRSPPFRQISVAIAVMMSACSGDIPVDGRAVSLHEITRYGASEPSPAGWTERELELGGDVLADIAGVIVGDADEILVLDRDWRKVLVYGESGKTDSMILGGPGEAPGEFRLPVHIAGAGADSFSVIDHESRRLTLFAGRSAVEVFQIPGGQPLRHAFSDMGILVLTRSRGSGSILNVLDGQGSWTAIELPRFAEDDPFHGATDLVAHGSDRILLTTPQPGVWLEFHQGRFERIGDPLFPQQPPPSRIQVGENLSVALPARATAARIAILSDSVVVQGSIVFPESYSAEDLPDPDDAEDVLNFFALDGSFLGTAFLPPNLNASCLTGLGPRPEILLCSNDPFPQVVRFAVSFPNSRTP